MPRTRMEIARNVGSAFLPSKRQATEAAASQADLVAALLRARHAAKLQPGEGSDIIEAAHEGLTYAIKAVECHHRTHSLLAVLRAAWNVPPMMYGEEDTPPSKTKRALSIVEAA